MLFPLEIFDCILYWKLISFTKLPIFFGLFLNCIISQMYKLIIDITLFLFLWIMSLFLTIILMKFFIKLLIRLFIRIDVIFDAG